MTVLTDAWARDGWLRSTGPYAALVPAEHDGARQERRWRAVLVAGVAVLTLTIPAAVGVAVAWWHVLAPLSR